jgi:hypothetical protein
MFNAAKDTMTSRAAQHYVNNQIVRYGEVQKLKIDSRQKTVEVSCLLHGEPSPIGIKIENYIVETDGVKKFFQATDISCTRPWLQNLLADFARNRRIELPSWADGVL